MKRFLGWIRPLLKQAVATIIVASMLLVVFAVTVAGISGDYGTLSRLIIAGRLTMKTASYAFFTGTSYVAMGDSAYLSVGKFVADSSEFAVGQKRKGVYTGGTVNSVYLTTGRAGYVAVSGEIVTDSISTLIQAYAKTDSAVFVRTGTLAQTGKFNYLHLKLR